MGGQHWCWECKFALLAAHIWIDFVYTQIFILFDKINCCCCCCCCCCCSLPHRMKQKLTKKLKLKSRWSYKIKENASPQKQPDKQYYNFKIITAVRHVDWIQIFFHVMYFNEIWALKLLFLCCLWLHTCNTVFLQHKLLQDQNTTKSEWQTPWLLHRNKSLLAWFLDKMSQENRPPPKWPILCRVGR